MFSNVWSENTALFERLMEIHSNSPKLYYGFKGCMNGNKMMDIDLTPLSTQHYLSREAKNLAGNGDEFLMSTLCLCQPKERVNLNFNGEQAIIFTVKCYMRCNRNRIFSFSFSMEDIQYRSKETPQLIGLFSPNLVITNFMQCYLYGPIG